MRLPRLSLGHLRPYSFLKKLPRKARSRSGKPDRVSTADWSTGKKGRSPSRRDREKEGCPRGCEPSRCSDRERSDRRPL